MDPVNELQLSQGQVDRMAMLLREKNDANRLVYSGTRLYVTQVNFRGCISVRLGRQEFRGAHNAYKTYLLGPDGETLMKPADDS